MQTPEEPPPPSEPAAASPLSPPPVPSALPSDVAVPNPSGPLQPPYPVRMEITHPEELNRWLPLIKWLLVIPHLFALVFVCIGALFVLIWAFFAVLFTARWPRGAFEYLTGTLRWSARVTIYAYLMTDRYPPFSLQDDPDYPLRLNIDYPEHIDRWRPLVQWLLILPYAIGAAVLGWLAGLISIAAFFAILITKRIPRELFEIMVVGVRWQMRSSAYSAFMTDKYPRFIWG